MAGDEGYNLTRSLRFRASASAYLNRTPAVTGNQQKWTYSAWVKLGSIDSSAYVNLLTTQYNTASTGSTLVRLVGNVLYFSQYDSGTLTINLTSSQVFRDPSAWYHIVCAVDTTQATAANRIKFYVNGVQITSFSAATYPVLNQNTYVDAGGYVHIVGGLWFNGGGGYSIAQTYDGYLAETNFIDGQSLTPSSFGSYNSTTGVWQPAAYTGTYGTNGFYLPFTDNSALTTSSNVGLGKDFSGNGNYWTTNNISITAGVTYDSMTDVPTLTSATASNFAVLNPLDKGSNAALVEANMAFLATGTYSARSTMALPVSGKYYWENIVGSGGSAAICTGIATKDASLANYIGGDAYGWGYYSADGKVYNNNAAIATYSASATGDVIGFAFDAGAGTLQVFKNNTSLGTITGLTSYGNYFPALGNSNGAAYVNFGQRPFTYTPPTGFNSLNSFNIPEGSITTSGSFIGNVNTEGPSVYLNGVPTAMTINGNAVTFGTHADKTAYGFKVRSSSTSYNSTGTNTYSITTTGAKFKYANAQGNP